MWRLWKLKGTKKTRRYTEERKDLRMERYADGGDGARVRMVVRGDSLLVRASANVAWIYDEDDRNCVCVNYQARYPVCNDVDVEIQLLCRNVRFLRSLDRSNNHVVRCCFQLVQNGSRSTVSRSFSKLCDVTQKSRHHIVESVCHPTALFKIGNDHEEMAGLVRDLLALRAGLELDQNLSAHDIELLRDINFSIRELCTH
ncbi:hypothetical protein CAPTEDRAFT_198590 [Capitella teleta]|uniref:Uncharacterized protein n=1 Tax=Capitella teleta TaxID=283909 RepID=R7V5W9_CAPTE|nr:hypothetical protein CAPTEDRAFT_198590 [Capitella teleta]|eukprot:ELU11721.1 hypothetical protein CAPTEDRAFT_198590 [Capitella teleta]